MTDDKATKITFAEWAKTNHASSTLLRDFLADCFQGNHDRRPTAAELVAVCDEAVNRSAEELANLLALAHHERDMDKLYRCG
jgi:hypothetical protein